MTTPCAGEVRRRAAQPPGFALFPTPDATSSLAAAPDGSIWLVGADIGKIAIDGRWSVVASGVNCSGGGVFRGDGALVCVRRSATEDVLQVVEPAGRVETIPLGASFRAGSLVAAPDGTILFRENQTRRLWRLTQNAVVTDLELPEGFVPGAMAITSDGTAWFIAGPALVRVNKNGTYDVFRDDALFERRQPGAGFSRLVAGAGGRLWLAIPTEDRTSGYHRTGAIVSFTPDGSFHEELVISSPTLVAAAHDASVWFIQDIPPGFFGPYVPTLVHLTRQSEPQTFGVPIGFWPVSSHDLVVDSQNRPWLALTDPVARSRIAVLR